MADLLFPHMNSLVGRQAFDPMPDSTDEQWRYTSYHPQGYDQWSAQNHDLSDSHVNGSRVHDDDYAHQYQWDASQMLPRDFTFDPTAWTSNVEMQTATPAFHHEFASNLIQQPPHQTSLTHLYATSSHGGRSSMHSPQSSHSSFSPPQVSSKLSAMAGVHKRPAISRSITAPTMIVTHKPITPTSGSKGESVSGDDEDLIPAADDESKPRSRKRHRLPHTAVERRYRENLNARLDMLRMTVPAFVSNRSLGGGEQGPSYEAAKPSKVEVLNGAIDHIGELTQKNEELELQVKTLQAKINDLERHVARGGRR